MIRFIYFDVGGVVIKDFSASNKWKEFQHDLGVNVENEEKFQQMWLKYRSRICVDYDIEKLVPLLNSEVGLSIPINHSLLQGFISRFEKNESIWPIIEKIKKGIKIGLLTNMYFGMLNGIKKKGILPNVQWDTVIDSSVVGLQKPDPKLFQLAERKTGLAGSDILFIDNQEKHVNAAKACGWNSYFYDSSDYEKSTKQLGEYLKHVGIL
jgi:epoxide hydrolase-like predicted phosphatase